MNKAFIVLAVIGGVALVTLVGCPGKPASPNLENVTIGTPALSQQKVSSVFTQTLPIYNCGNDRPRSTQRATVARYEVEKEWIVGGKAFSELEAGIDFGLGGVPLPGGVTIPIEFKIGLAGRIGAEVEAAYERRMNVQLEQADIHEFEVGPNEYKEFVLFWQPITWSGSVPVDYADSSFEWSDSVGFSVTALKELQKVETVDIGCWQYFKDHADMTFSEDFASPDRGWVENEFLKISGEAYHYSLPEAGQGGYADIPGMILSEDLIVEVEIALQGISKGAYGVRFCDNEYELLISTDGQYALNRLSQAAGPLPLIPWTANDAIHPAGFNHIEVMVYHGRAAFFVNDENVSTIELGFCRQGGTGLAAHAFERRFRVVIDKVSLYSIP